ncbi:MAG: hypothetical protein PHF93_09790 [Acidobacteriota bacterium]|jgi:hypothetical protein|nr:hypothetical protein [Acidobacteriota bacterium]MDD8034097.1 hypothetical protein [Acidobacteriota bacterium]HOS11542.1 hypothetical protein [Candidatus Aminicenantes bacterium]HQJ42714.1 hypothetical protein [Candidatus Aminicenantes bacterium]
MVMIKLRWMGGTAFLLLAASCAVPLAEYEKNHYLLSPAGERIEIKDKAGGTAAGEFLFADEDSVYVLIDGQKDLPPRVAAMPYKTIRTLKIRGVKNDKWLSAVLLFQGLPALLLGATYMVDTDNPGGGILLTALTAVPAAVTALFLGTGPPAISLGRGGVDREKMRGFLKYARYPFIPDAVLKQKILDGLKRPAGPRTAESP